MKATMKEMTNYILNNNLVKLVNELNRDGNNFEGAVQWVYDSHTMTKEEFLKKYFNTL